MLISNQMKNAILKNTNVIKLTKNEYNVYTLLNKYKNDDTNLLISSYLSGNTLFYSYFENIKSYYSMKVKKDDTFYNIDFIDSQFEISDININLQEHLIKFDIQTEDETPKIQIISEVNTYSVLIFIEKGLE